MMKTEIVEPVNLGIGETNHVWLKKFKDENIFSEMRDAYRFAAAYAISKDLPLVEINERKETVFSLASVDPDRSLYHLITALYPDLEIARYNILDRLANTGMTELVRMYKEDRLDLARLIRESV
ncbi:hypothetical protein G6704_02785 [Polynucleobacter paneuropaeus]|nr:hypothetical protein G6704_02785 [Polynucleobacter paneuropaeus]